MKITLAVACVMTITISYQVTGYEDSDSGVKGENIHVKMNSMTALDMNGRLKSKFAWVAALGAPERNMVCSPLSALLPLGKLALGAQGKALKQLYSAIGVPDKRQLKASFKRTIHRLKNLPGVILDLASRLYVSTNTKLKKTYVDDAREIFQSSCEKVDFSAPKRAAESINSWVSQQTNQMIPDIISPADISPDTSLIVVNAVYFNGNWKYPFRKVSSGIFNSPRGQRKVLMMHQKNIHNYYKSDVLNAQIIELPYKNEHATFVIVLPNRNHGLSHILDELNVIPHILSSEMGKMRMAPVNLTMPKFKVQTDLDLKILYQKIGVRAIFGDLKALPDIAHGSPLTVTKSIQKAIIEVSELGTEASAASMSNIETTAAFVKRENVYVDHPFLFIVKVKHHQLFVGIVNSP